MTDRDFENIFDVLIDLCNLQRGSPESSTAGVYRDLETAIENITERINQLHTHLARSTHPRELNVMTAAGVHLRCAQIAYLAVRPHIMYGDKERYGRFVGKCAVDFDNACLEVISESL